MGKTNKVIKVTDRGKPWLKRKQSAYHAESKEKRKTFLIVCEGQTEEQYFKAFPVITATVRLMQLGGRSRTRLVECAKAFCDDESYDEVWCVFDFDANGNIKGQQEEFNNAIRLCANLHFKCAYSNDAFELWLVLHYQYLEQEHLRSKYYELLSKYWNINYERHGKVKNFAKNIYARLLNDPQASQLKAIINADKLLRLHHNKPCHNQNPVTLVHQLVKELNKHART